MKSIELTLLDSSKISISTEVYAYSVERGAGATVYLNFPIEIDEEVVQNFDCIESVTDIDNLINS